MATSTVISNVGTNKPPSAPKARKKNYTQTVSIAIGCLMIVIGLAGLLYAEFMGLHMSVMHSLVLTISGALAIWAASGNNPRNAYRVDLGLGIFFAINAIAGFLLGGPGMPGVGYQRYDELLIRIAPGFIELGLVDHVLHAFFAVFFITGAIWWKRRHRESSILG